MGSKQHSFRSPHSTRTVHFAPHALLSAPDSFPYAAPRQYPPWRYSYSTLFPPSTLSVPSPAVPLQYPPSKFLTADHQMGDANAHIGTVPRIRGPRQGSRRAMGESFFEVRCLKCKRRKLDQAFLNIILKKVMSTLFNYRTKVQRREDVL